MRVTIVSTYSGRRIHIADGERLLYTLCGARPERVVQANYELTDAEPNIAGLSGLCKACRALAMPSGLRVAKGE